MIPPRICQEETSTNKTPTDKTLTNKRINPETVVLESIIVVPNRYACPEDQKKDQHGTCRDVI